MKPNCNDNNKSKSAQQKQQKPILTVIPPKEEPSNDVDSYKRTLLNHADCGHRPKSCIMCNGSDKLFIQNNMQRMDKGNFHWHFNLLFSSNGQRLDRELLGKAYEHYKREISLLRQHSKIKNSATPVSIIIGKLECPHE